VHVVTPIAVEHRRLTPRIRLGTGTLYTSWHRRRSRQQ
jgi:hypothetical protein